MDSDPRLVVFFIILSTNPKMLQMMNILVYILLLIFIWSLGSFGVISNAKGRGRGINGGGR